MTTPSNPAPLILGVSGLRGIVGESLTPDVAMRYAAAFGGWLRDRGNHHAGVVIGTDGRAGYHVILHAAVAGVLASNHRVFMANTCTTPSLGKLVDAGNISGGIVLTASHNPQQWNGLKCIVPADARTGESQGARAPTAAEAAEIIERFHATSFPLAVSTDRAPPEVWSSPEPVENHLAWLRPQFAALNRAGSVTLGSRRVRVVLDSVNASGARAAEALLHQLGVHAIQLHGDHTGIFPHTPEPTRENLSAPGGLCDAVPGLKADIGFAQDPDADRLAIVDEKGHYIGEEYTLALCAEAILSAREDDTPAHLVANLSTSRMIDDVAAKYGATVHRTPVGEANVVERMKQLIAEGHDVVLGGEGNGGVIWPKVVYIRDSLSAMALTLALMARTGKTVSQLVEQINSASPGGKGYAILKRKADIPSKDAAKPAVAAVARHFARERVDLQDGVRVDFNPTGPWAGSWVHVRASNTEPIMRLICEAPTEAIAQAVLGQVQLVLQGRDEIA